MPRKTAKSPGQSTNAAKKPPHQSTPGRKCSANQSTIESTNSEAKHRKTAARPLTTDNLPTLIKEVFNNLRQPQDEPDSSEESHNGERPATRQARQDQGYEQDSPLGNNARTSSRNAAST